jgi:hypothetical protein
MDWLARNVPWVFSGIGVAIIVWVSAVIASARRRAEERRAEQSRIENERQREAARVEEEHRRKAAARYAELLPIEITLKESLENLHAWLPRVELGLDSFFSKGDNRYPRLRSTALESHVQVAAGYSQPLYVAVRDAAANLSAIDSAVEHLWHSSISPWEPFEKVKNVASSAERSLSRALGVIDTTIQPFRPSGAS